MRQDMLEYYKSQSVQENNPEAYMYPYVCMYVYMYVYTYPYTYEYIYTLNLSNLPPSRLSVSISTPTHTSYLILYGYLQIYILGSPQCQVSVVPPVYSLLAE